ncbi:MAG: fibrobacter succinogenes major paralogous domain-containing protein [Ferruginibacter sp.]|nr:fibrobacter succinogenes major paralogous domain-containing protein [Ferruginibacter sp.]
MKQGQLLLFAFLLATTVGTQAQNVGIGTTTPAASAQLDVSSINKGFLPPRMTAAQRNDITNPVPGLVIYCTDCDELQVFNGIMWKNLSGTAATVGNTTTMPTITICTQIWMGLNLSVSKFKDGTPIPELTDPAVWLSTTLPAWCWYNNDSANFWQYGKLYNWYAVNDSRGLAPTGWHIPSDAEWTTLTNCLSGTALAGGKIKEAGTVHWNSPNTNATNSSGFTGLPGGLRSVSTGSFESVGNYANWWSSTPYDIDLVWYRYAIFSSGTLTQGATYKANGFSVRCVKNN